MAASQLLWFPGKSPREQWKWEFCGMPSLLGILTAGCYFLSDAELKETEKAWPVYESDIRSLQRVPRSFLQWVTCILKPERHFNKTNKGIWALKYNVSLQTSVLKSQHIKYNSHITVYFSINIQREHDSQLLGLIFCQMICQTNHESKP